MAALPSWASAGCVDAAGGDAALTSSRPEELGATAFTKSVELIETRALAAGSTGALTTGTTGAATTGATTVAAAGEMVVGCAGATVAELLVTGGVELVVGSLEAAGGCPAAAPAGAAPAAVPSVEWALSLAAAGSVAGD
jgi:hypothetical protein